MNPKSNGVLISIEGIDGCGKSTLAGNLFTLLENKNLPTVLTKEPGGTEVGKQLRYILQKQTIPLDPKAEYLLFAADRAEHFQKVIKPNLDLHKIIISDRMADSSLVYQGYGRGLDHTMINSINKWTMQNINPDLVIYIRIDLETAHDRLQMRNKELTAFEQDYKFTKKLIAGFDTIFKDRKNIIYLDGKESPETLADQALQEILIWLKK